MLTLDDQIEQAEKAVLNGRRIVALQQERIASGMSFNTAHARDVLDTFQRTLKLLEDDLDRLLAQRSSD